MIRVGRFTLKDRITLYDMGEAEKLLNLVKAEKSNSTAIVYLKKIVRLLTTAKFVTRWDLRSVDKILLAAGFSGDKKEIQPADENGLLNLTSWIGARVNQTPYQIATSMVAAEVSTFVKAITRKILEESMRLLRAHHSPEEFGEELVHDLKALSLTEEEERRIENPVKKPNMVEMMRQAYRAK